MQQAHMSSAGPHPWESVMPAVIALLCTCQKMFVIWRLSRVTSAASSKPAPQPDYTYQNARRIGTVRLQLAAA